MLIAVRLTLTASKILPLSGDDAVVFCGFAPAPSDIIEADLRGNGATRNPSSREVAAIFSRRAISRATSYRRSSAQSAAGTEACVRTTQTVGQRVTPLAWVNAATAASYSLEDLPGGVMTGLAVAPIIGDILLEFVVLARRAPSLARREHLAIATDRVHCVGTNSHVFPPLNSVLRPRDPLDGLQFYIAYLIYQITSESILAIAANRRA